MNNQARICELKCKYNVQGICHAYGECIAKDLFISELEEIRKEAYSKSYYLEWDNRGSTYVQLRLLNRIIDNHISELKGE